MANWLNQLQSLLGQKPFFYLLVCGSGIGQTFSARRIRRTGWAAGRK